MKINSFIHSFIQIYLKRVQTQIKKDKKKMQFLSIFNKYKVLAAQYLGDAMGHFPFRYTFIFVVRYQFQFAINLRHQCRLVPALMDNGELGIDGYSLYRGDHSDGRGVLEMELRFMCIIL